MTSARPMSSSGLVAMLCDLLVTRGDAARLAGHGVRFGVDGCLPDDGTRLGDAVRNALGGLGHPAIRVSQADFTLPRGQRLESGALDPLAMWGNWYDDAALWREVLEPFGPGGALTWLPTLRDPHTDRSTRAARRRAHAGTVVVLDGRFLLRPELAGAFDLVVHLRTTPATQARRIGDPAARDRAIGSWQHYLRHLPPQADGVEPPTRIPPEHLPSEHIVVRYDHPDRPAVLCTADQPS